MVVFGMNIQKEEITKNNKPTPKKTFASTFLLFYLRINDDFQTFPYAFGIGLGMTFKFL